uniref:Uncharacterized protein n=1 Tax=Rhizophora mucronata TaxID=61149 RepID=A0A2P2NMK0_RHIMU
MSIVETTGCDGPSKTVRVHCSHAILYAHFHVHVHAQ